MVMNPSVISTAASSGATSSSSFRLQYATVMTELTFNSKPIINKLTQLAETNPNHAQVIVTLLEDQLAKVSPQLKIPFFYLVDSILKNVGEPYIRLFAKNLVQTCLKVYSAVNAQDKDRVRRVVNTWKTLGSRPIFPITLIHQVEKALGPAPTLRPASNPAQASNLSRPQQASSSSSSSVSRPLIPLPGASQSPVPTQDSIKNLIMQALAQKITLQLANPNDAVNNSQIPVLQQLLTTVQSTQLDTNTLQLIQTQIQQLMTPPAPVLPSGLSIGNSLPRPTLGLGSYQNNMPVSFPPNLGTALNLMNPMSSIPPTIPLPTIPSQPLQSSFPRPQQPQSSLPDFSKSDLLNMISATGGLPGLPPSKISQLSRPPVAPPVLSLSSLPVIRLRAQDIQNVTSYPGAVGLLYEAMSLQCKQCGLRLKKDPDGHGESEMADHLDWHFRQNKRVKEGKRTLFREWYVPESEWVQEDGLNVDEKAVVPAFFGEETVTDEKEELEPVVRNDIPAEGEKSSTCVVCHEPLEKYYDDDADEWMLKGVIKFNDRFYHQDCFKDEDGDSSMTPIQEGLKRKSEPSSLTGSPVVGVKKLRV